MMTIDGPNYSLSQEHKTRVRCIGSIPVVPRLAVEWLRIPALLFFAIGTLGLSKALSLRAAGLLKSVNLPDAWICITLLCASAFLYVTIIIALLRERVGTQNHRQENPEKVRIKYRWRSV